MLAWVADGVSASVEALPETDYLWPAGPDVAPTYSVRGHRLDEAPPEALGVGRDDFRFVARPDHHYEAYAAPTTQASSAALHLGLAVHALEGDGLLIHAAGLAWPGKGGVVALAPSGGGKSTLSTLAIHFTGLSDETVLLRRGPPATICATPFRSTAQKVPERRSEVLRALLILEKSPEPRFSRVGPDEALRVLFGQAYQLPPELAPRATLFRRARELAESAPAYRFAFPKSPEAEALLVRLYDEELHP